MSQLPRSHHWDSSIPLLRNPYGYIRQTCQELDTDLFETRLLLSKAICMTGPEAAGLFYTSKNLVRDGAAPKRVQWSLFGSGGVQTLDGPAHRHRKAMLLSILTSPERIDQLVRLVEELWRRDIESTAPEARVVLFERLQEILTRAACQWSGVYLSDDELPALQRELTALFDNAGDVGPKHWWSRLSRQTANRRIGEYIEEVRQGKVQVSEELPAYVIAHHRDLDGELLSNEIAAVELLNVLRPTVAVSVYMTFTALALHDYPEHRGRILGDEPDEVFYFAQEVRRFYPFFPAVPALVSEDFRWQGYEFAKDTRVLLDLYGTNHDRRVWADPEHFYPQRFIRSDYGPYGFIPQGGGEHETNHRCPGEQITIELVELAARFLANEVHYDVPEQDLEVDDTRLPALPKSGFEMENIRLKA